MEPEPHGENDESLSDDSRESAMERFAFLQEDQAFIQDLIASLRRVLGRKSITPQQIRGIGKLLHSLERLPRPTLGIAITLSTAASNPDYSTYHHIALDESVFEVYKGGSRYEVQGCERYDDYSFHVEVDGARKLEGSFLWTDFIESLCDEDQKLSVHDEYPDSVLDWDKKTPEGDWDQLDSAY